MQSADLPRSTAQIKVDSDSLSLHTCVAFASKFPDSGQAAFLDFCVWKISLASLACLMYGATQRQLAADDSRPRDNTTPD